MKAGGNYFMKDSLIVKSAIRQHLLDSNEKRRETRRKIVEDRDGDEKLWASDVGGCHRASILRVRGEVQTILPDSRLLDYMRIGVALEDETGKALEDIYGDDVDAQFVLKNDIWSGRPDFVLYHGTNHPILVEHKVTGEKGWWDHDLPRHKHLGQISLYGYLYEQQFGIEPRLILFYRGWGHYAELELFINQRTITVTGFIDDKAYLNEIKYPVLDEIKTLEEAYKNRQTDLPKKLRYKKDGCTFAGKPSCNMYYHCYDK